jgi:hypothetical protein
MTSSRSATDNLPISVDELFPREGRHAWVGSSPRFPAEAISLIDQPNFRMASSMHGRFDSVWFVESPLSDLSGGRFEIVIDELIRLLGARGQLVVRFRETADVSVVNLKQAIGRRLHLSAEVHRQWCVKGEYTVAFSIERKQLEGYQDRRWTFAVLTQGNKPEMVVRFLRSIRALDPAHEHELLVWGPMNQAYAEYGVRASERQYRSDVAEISRKKNDIADSASHANLLIAHDRYALNEDFFTGFDAFGYDFDLCAIAQRYEDGHDFPSYCALPGHKLVRASTTIDCPDANTLWPLQYVNGGLIVAKTQTLRQIRFNDLLFWCESEDVEMTRQFRERGLPPRVNRWASATTYGVDRAWYTGQHFTSEEQYLKETALRSAADRKPRFSMAAKIKRECVRFSAKVLGRAG